MSHPTLESRKLLNIRALVDEALCFQAIREVRWPDGVVRCPHCHSAQVVKYGTDETHRHRQKYRCKACPCYFDDLTNTVLKGRHQSIVIWVLCLYFMGLNLSNRQIAQELDLNKDVVQKMTYQLRRAVAEQKPKARLGGEVECDEVYVIAGHKGHPSAVMKQGRKGRRNRLKGARGRGTLEGEKPPILGMIQRGGEVAIHMLADVKQKTIAPLIEATIAPGSQVYTDEYNIYDRLTEWGYRHKTVCHSRGEYARDEDGDGFHEVHVNTMEGFWSLLRSWLRPHRGISQENLPLYLGFFEFVHNAKKRGKGLLDSLLPLLLT